MKRICVPDQTPVELKSIDNKKMTFHSFLISALNMWPDTGKGVANIKRACKIEDVIEAHKDDNLLLLEDDDYEFLKSAISSSSWIPQLSRELYRAGYFQAVMDAKDTQVVEANT